MKFNCYYCNIGSAIKALYEYKEKKVYKCTNCGLIFTYPFTKEKDLLKIYGENYFQNKAFHDYNEKTLYGYSNYIEERFYKQQNYVKIIEELENFYKINHKTRLLDFGCGLGYFMDVADDYECKVEGVDISEYAVNYIRNKYNFKVYKSDNIDIVDGKYNIITMFDLIEHVYDPFELIKNAGKKLYKNGFIVITTIDAGSIICKLIGKNVEDFRRTQEHFFFFNRKLIKIILENSGFEIKVMRSIGHTFELGHLCRRLIGYNKLIFSTLYKILKWSRFDRYSIYFNPHTKMLIIAKKKGV